MQTLEPCGTEDVTILAIESSCDETAAAVVRNGREVLSNIISSQIDIHKLYGGVVPEIANALGYGIAFIVSYLLNFSWITSKASSLFRICSPTKLLIKFLPLEKNS